MLFRLIGGASAARRKYVDKGVAYLDQQILPSQQLWILRWLRAPSIRVASMIMLSCLSP